MLSDLAGLLAPAGQAASQGRSWPKTRGWRKVPRPSIVTFPIHPHSSVHPKCSVIRLVFACWLDLSLVRMSSSATLHAPRRIDSAGCCLLLLAPLPLIPPAESTARFESSPISQIHSARTTRIVLPPLSFTPLPSFPPPPLNPRRADRQPAAVAAAPVIAHFE